VVDERQKVMVGGPNTAVADTLRLRGIVPC